MEKQFSEDFDKIFVESNNEFEEVTPISTGSMSLDSSIGLGGVPRRRYTVIAGPDGAGKTTLAFSIAKSALAMGLKVLYVDMENQMDYDYIPELIGEDHIGKDFILAKPGTSDDAFEIIEAAIASDEFGLIVLDSIGALAPKKEKEKEFDAATIALTPRDMSKFLRRNSFNIRVNNIAMVFINQVRADLNSTYIKQYSNPGGYAIKHYASLIINMNAPAKIKMGDEIIGISAKFVIKKNKLAAPFRSGEIPIMFGTGVDYLRDFVQFTSLLGIIKRRGSFYVFEEEKLGQGIVQTMEYLNSHKEVLDKIKSLCYNVSTKYKREIEDLDESTLDNESEEEGDND